MGRFVKNARYEVYSVRVTEEEKDLFLRLSPKETREVLRKAAERKEVKA